MILRKKEYLRADPPGFEPGVFGLEVRRPIQLGYGPLYTTIINLFFLLFIFIYKRNKKIKGLRGYVYPLPKNSPDALYWNESTLFPSAS